MHLTRNLYVNILGFLGLYEKSKDTPKAREDQEHHKERDSMYPRQFQGRAGYTLNKEDKEIFFEVLFSIKVPTGFSQAHYTVLHNSTVVASYIMRHKNILRSENLGKADSWIKGEHEKTFGSWLQTYLMNDDTVGDQLYCLARPPSFTIYTFQGYEINGNTFYTVAQDKKSNNQNSGVRFDATDDNGQN
jgi:hypothetical protein